MNLKDAHGVSPSVAVRDQVCAAQGDTGESRVIGS
jgi:hypothetical protein